MEKTITCKVLADRIRRHPMLQDVPFETILDYLVDFIQIVGCPQLYEEKTQVIPVKDYKGLLPCNYVSMIQVRNAPPPDDHIADDYPGIRRHSAYRYAGDSFHMSPDKPDVGRGGTDLTYKIQGSVIFTSTKDKPIEIAYHAIATDPEGYPLIPDNPSFMRAFESYVKKQHFTILFDMGKIQPAVLSQALQDYAFYVGQCQSDLIMPSIDQMESITNSWNTLIIRANEHAKGFINNGSKEYLTLQP